MQRKQARSDGEEILIKDRVFSIDLKSRNSVRNAYLPAGGTGGVLIEGTLGRLVSAGFRDGVVFEMRGTEGVLRVDLLSAELSDDLDKTEVKQG